MNIKNFIILLKKNTIIKFSSMLDFAGLAFNSNGQKRAPSRLFNADSWRATNRYGVGTN